MKKFIVSHAWWITLLLGLSMLLAHTLSFEKIKVDNTSIILLLVIFLSPFVSAITKIKFGDFEAEIDPKEVQKIKDDVSTQVSDADKSIQNSDIENTIVSINELVNSDPILALAKLRIDLEKALSKLYRMTHKDSKGNRVLSAGQLVHALSNAEILPKDIASSTREVISICNRAIHGEDIRQQDAKSVVESGVSLLSELYFNASEYVLKPIESIPIDKATLDELWDAQYRVTTVVPLVESPHKSVRIVNQEGLDELLEGYNEYGEFIIGIEKINSEGGHNKSLQPTPR